MRCTEANPMSANRMTLAAELTELIAANAHRYLMIRPGEPLDVSLASDGDRVLSSLYRFRIAGRTAVHEILIKLPGPADDVSERPRLIVLPDKPTRAEFEYATLTAIER